MEVARQAGQFLLCRGVFGCGGVESRSSSVGLAAGLARRRFGVRRLFLLVGVSSGLRITRESAEQEQRSANNYRQCAREVSRK